jgi:hypothetical protein
MKTTNDVIDIMDELKPKCDMLLDQSLVIDGDPCGHCCCNDAVYQGMGLFFCQRCVDLLAAGSERVTIPRAGSVCLWESGSVRATVDGLFRAIKPPLDE